LDGKPSTISDVKNDKPTYAHTCGVYETRVRTCNNNNNNNNNNNKKYYKTKTTTTVIIIIIIIIYHKFASCIFFFLNDSQNSSVFLRIAFFCKTGPFTLVFQLRVKTKKRAKSGSNLRSFLVIIFFLLSFVSRTQHQRHRLINLKKQNKKRKQHSKGLYSNTEPTTIL